MENNRHWGRRKRIIERQSWREWLRWEAKHHSQTTRAKICTLATKFIARLSIRALETQQKELTQLLKPLISSPKFCNDLIGVSLTDYLPAPEIN